jgi:DNA modification methylase
VSLIRGDALTIPLADNTVDLIVTSPPYFALRSYTDACGTCGGRVAERFDTNGQGKSTLVGGGTKKNPKPERFEERVQQNAVPADPDCPECDGSGRGHYAGQIGSEATPAAFIDALIAVTRECVRVLKPSGSLFVNLGDKYSGAQAQNISGENRAGDSARTWAQTNPANTGIRTKSLMGLPWRYALACIDDLGLILRAEIIWSKPNGLPESVQDRVRRSHEQWFHFSLEPRYYSAVDEIREPHTDDRPGRVRFDAGDGGRGDRGLPGYNNVNRSEWTEKPNGLGKLPGSVWTVPTEPLRVPDHLPQHFAAFPSEWPRRIILGWSPTGICVECGEGRRPVVKKAHDPQGRTTNGPAAYEPANHENHRRSDVPIRLVESATITGESCACPTPTAPTRPAVILDPFAGTGTVPAVANALGRYGVGIDLSADYLRLARWRLNDPGLRAKALQVDKPPTELVGQHALF